jgi:methylthioribose-1-phosphate isomerase
MHQPIPTLRWEGGVDGHLILLDQTRLPEEVVQLHCHAVEEVWQAIKRLSVRGAPAIGVAAAYGVCLPQNSSGSLPLEERVGEGMRSGYPTHLPHQAAGTRGENEGRILLACDYLATARPTAVNLFWALDRMRQVVQQSRHEGPQHLAESLLAEARAIHAEDVAMCTSIGAHGADLLSDLPAGAGILTHCNAGALCATGAGTALGVIFELARRGRRPHVWVDETRPLLQGARLTAWELIQRGIDCTLITDSMAAQVMREGRVQAVVVGADRIVANGDAANKIGTYGVAVLAKAHGIPFYVAAPSSTFDPAIATGAEICIEQRPAEEITCAFGKRTAPAGVNVFNPAFDVTPAELIRAIITERGVISPVTKDAVAATLARQRDAAG